MNLTSSIITSIEDIPQTDVSHILYTWFRPSAPQTKKTEWSALTLGHVLQVNNMIKTHEAITNQTADALTICVIADKQWSLDYRTSEHSKLLEIYKEKYIQWLFSVLGERAYDENLLIYEEKELDNIVTTFSLEAANYFTLEDYLNHSVEKERKIQSNLANMWTFAKILWSTLFQSGSMAAVNASLVSGWRDQMGTVRLYGDILLNAKKRWVVFPRERVTGITQNGMLIGVDGNIMSTSKGNYIDIGMSQQEIEKKILDSHDLCKKSLQEEFGSVDDVPTTVMTFQENAKNLNKEDVMKKIKDSNERVADIIKSNYSSLVSF